MGREGERGETADVNNTPSEVNVAVAGRTRGINKILKCKTLNAQSLTNKMDEFKLIVSDIKPHIISITESWGPSVLRTEYSHYKDIQCI